MKRLVENSNVENQNGIGILTAENRDVWCNNFAKLCKSIFKRNLKILKY